MSRSEEQAGARSELLQGLMRAEKDLSRISLMFRSAIANEFGMNATDAECVDYLMDIGPASAGQLAEVTGLTQGAITNVIDRLENAGFVTRESDPNDRRKVIVAPVQAKIDEVAEVYRPTVMRIFELYSGYTEEEMGFLLDFYQKIMKIYQEGIDQQA